MADLPSLKDMDTKRINEEYKIWKKNVCFMYDYVITHSTEWPTLSLDFVPSPDSSHEDFYLEHILTSTYTNGKE
jgi:histone-binding protein RBBP4